MSIWDNQEKSGQAWLYNETNMEYDSEFDPDGGLPVYYNGVGSSSTFTNEIKH
jgi:hypothetical protein